MDGIEDLPHLSEDPEIAAVQYTNLREHARETFQCFLRNLNSQSLRAIEETFYENDGELDIVTFLNVCPSVFPKMEFADFPHQEERDFIVQLAAKMLFEDVDVDQSGGADWMEFVNFVCAIAETLRIQAEQSNAQFQFREAAIMANIKHYRPQITKCLFSKVYYWPQHPSDNVLVFEEGQPSFHLHKVKTMQRRKRERAEGHRSDLLCATFMPAPFDMVATTGNDKLLCFWEGGFNLCKRWKVDAVIGAICWCPEINAMYYADPETWKLQAWKIEDALYVRSSLKPPKIEKSMTFITEHKESIQQILWMKELQCIATASLDKTVRIFDLVSMQRTHVFSAAMGGHTKGVCCMEYCPRLQLLLSAGFNNYICLWDPPAGVRFHTLQGHDCSITAICMVPNSDGEVASLDLHGVVKLWDLKRLVCTQTFHTVDAQAEKAAEIEALEPRAMCCLGRDRLLISGRRMVAYERDFSQPRLTADSPIMAITFSHRKFEIATCEQNNVRIWCALTGKIVAVHSHVVEGNITVIQLGIGERRCFVGSDKGELASINFACGAPLKSLSPHICEVTQILIIPEKILTLSTAEKLIRIHDDTNPEKAAVLKEIDLGYLEPIFRISYDGDNVICGGTEDGLAVWFAVDYAKQVSSTERSEVKHQDSITRVLYLTQAPLVATADSEGVVIFWSIAPLRSYEFFSQLLMPPGVGSDERADAGSGASVAITSICFSFPLEEDMIIGMESGTLACVSIQEIVHRAQSQRDEISFRKDHGEATDVISGKIFESIPKPDNRFPYVTRMDMKWVRKSAHRGSIDQVVYCKLLHSVIISLGFDVKVCLWNPETGEPLGTLEQGLPDGVYNRVTEWHFPIDARDQVKKELAALAKAREPEEEEDENSKTGSEHGKEKESARGESRTNSMRAGSKVSQNREGPRRCSQSRSSPNLLREKRDAALRDRRDYSATPSRLLQSPSWRVRISNDDWFAGPYGKVFQDSPQFLPQLQSGRLRQIDKKPEKSPIIKAAKRLSFALSTVQSAADLRPIR